MSNREAFYLAFTAGLATGLSLAVVLITVARYL